jgi:diguanylate cyclase (GGDEF)-like protein/PAS domain S-box-containing protein
MTQFVWQKHRAFYGALALFFVCTFTLIGYTLWHLHAQAVSRGVEKTEIYAQNVESLLTQSLNTIDLVRSNILLLGVGGSDLRKLERSLVDALRSTPFLRSISLQDAAGRIVASTNPANLGVSVKTQEYKPTGSWIRETMRVGQTWFGRDFADGQPATATATASASDEAKARSFVPVAVRLNDGDMTLLIALNPDYFTNHATGLLEAQQGVVDLLGFDGSLLMSTEPTQKFGLPHDDIDAHGLLVASRASDAYPLVVRVSLYRGYVLQDWYRQVKTLLGFTIPGALLIGLVAVALHRRKLKFDAQRDKLISTVVFDTSSDAITITDSQSNIVSVNGAFTRETGYSAEEVLGRDPRLLASGQHNNLFYKNMWEDLLRDGVWRGELVNRRKDGILYDVEMTISIARDAEKGVQHFISVSRDITERKQAEVALLKASALQDAIFNSANFSSIATDAKGVIQIFNVGAERMLGYSAAEALNNITPADISDPLELIARAEALSAELSTPITPGFEALVFKASRGMEDIYELTYVRKDGSRFPAVVSVTALRDAQNAIIGYLLIGTDNTARKQDEEVMLAERKEAADQMAYLAKNDSLTGLPNRVLFKERLDHAITAAQARDKLVAVVLLDLVRFKNVNDTLGHDAGDQILKQVAQRLLKTMRSVDTVARMSGDEFTIVMTSIRNVDDVARVAQKILNAFEPPFYVAGRELHMGASLGIAIYPLHAVNAKELMSHADIAMYTAKAADDNRYRFYQTEMTTQAVDALALENELRHALKRGEFLLHYQPVVDAGGRIVGAEALLRWQHGQRGLIQPARFIALAETTGLILPIGDWVLREAIAQAKTWKNPNGALLGLGVNVSPRQFNHGSLAETVQKVLAETGLNPSALHIEITEGVIMQEEQHTQELFDQLSHLGISFVIDDFGTGYSNLGYLKRFPIDSLKIDQSFIRDITTDPNDAAIVKAIIVMAHGLGIKTIAEGVETREQKEFLLAQGCDFMQGYYFSRPLAPEAFAALLDAGKPLGNGSDSDNFQI